MNSEISEQGNNNNNIDIDIFFEQYCLKLIYYSTNAP